MKQLFQFVQVCKEMSIDNPKSEDSLYFAKPVISKALWPSMLTVKSEDKLGRVSSKTDDWRKDNGYERDQDRIETRIADNRAKILQWSSVLKLIDLPDMRSVILDGVRWITEKNENPVHSHLAIEEWASTARKRLGQDGAVAYAIEMLNQKAKNSAGDWLKYGKQAGGLLADMYFDDHEPDYPSEVIEVIAKRLGHMIGHCHRYPRIERAAALGEMEDLLEAC